MTRRALIIAIAVAALMVGLVPNASAGLYSGSCQLVLTFNFSSGVGLDTKPSYSISASPAVDLDPTWSGSQPCLVTLDAFNPTRETSVSGSGSSSIWACGAVLASGSWDQSWTNKSGGSSPSAIFGSHTITGSFGEWILEVRNPLSFVGAAEMTVHPLDATKAAQCASGGFSSIRMIGTMVFQDP